MAVKPREFNHFKPSMLARYLSSVSLQIAMLVVKPSLKASSTY